MGKTPTYDLYVDDSGSREPDHEPAVRDDGLDAFALGGVLVPSEDAYNIVTAVSAIQGAVEIDYPLHSTEIRCQKDNFVWVGKDADRTKILYAEIDKLVSSFSGWVTAAVVHRPGYNDRYKDQYGGERWRLCKSAYQILIERAAKIARADGRMLKVFVERTGGREDKQIRGYQRAIYENGMGFAAENSGKYGPLTAAELQGILVKNVQFVKKSNAVMQLADLVLYPVVKGRYDSSYRPYVALNAAQKLIDYRLGEGLENCGIKYYCFDGVEAKN
ncbi:MAG: DUF3800 domain-containing protein [Alphaproteobacteria bacterium]|nr:hypothetical protein [Hyphomonas sp.]MBR9807655.1 DUF3800 domain-containing protein [Alphaproteobacteria bacterium]|tara:strand:+ start:1788 stop:2609 length:822 start_codon:yes stop_codon:yes gene_type:complete